MQNPLLTQIVTIKDGVTQKLATAVEDNGDGTFTAAARTQHRSPFVLVAPGAGTPVPIGYFSWLRPGNVAGSWEASRSSPHSHQTDCETDALDALTAVLQSYTRLPKDGLLADRRAGDR